MARIWSGAISKALIVENPARELDELLRAAGVEVHRLENTPDEDGLIAAVNALGAQAIFKRSKVGVSRRVIESCPSLLVVQLCCIGDDSVDKDACAEHGVMVFNDPVSNGRSVVELVIGSLIAQSRRLFETTTTCRTGKWEKNNRDRYEILGKTLGVIGLGNIGRAVARAAEHLGMSIVFFDTRQVSIELGKELGWSYVESIEDCFRSSDCVTIHLSAQDVAGLSNQGRISSESLKLLGANRPPGPRVLINFARGFLFPPSALIEAIECGAIRRAAVDVYPVEPRLGQAWENPYRDCPEVAVFPHIGASTQEAQPRIAARVADTFLSFSRFGTVRDTPFKVRAKLRLSAQGKPGQYLLMVCHSTARGTKRAIDEAIYEANISNVSSVHRDFDDYGFAYDLALLDAELDEAAVADIINRAASLTGDAAAIRSVRQTPA